MTPLPLNGKETVDRSYIPARSLADNPHAKDWDARQILAARRNDTSVLWTYVNGRERGVRGRSFRGMSLAAHGGIYGIVGINTARHGNHPALVRVL